MNGAFYKAQILLKRSRVWMQFLSQWCTVQFVHCPSLWVCIYLAVLVGRKRQKKANSALARERAVLQVPQSGRWCLHCTKCHADIMGHLMWAGTVKWGRSGCWGRWIVLSGVKRNQHFPYLWPSSSFHCQWQVPLRFDSFCSWPLKSLWDATWWCVWRDSGQHGSWMTRMAHTASMGLADLTLLPIPVVLLKTIRLHS